MPLIIGSTTPRVAATATAASKALPPCERISRPAWVARGLAELTIPEDPVAGLVGLFWVGSRAVLAAGLETAGSAVSSPTTDSSDAASSSARGASSKTEDRAPQELSPATSTTMKDIKKIFLKDMLLKKLCIQTSV